MYNMYVSCEVWKWAGNTVKLATFLLSLKMAQAKSLQDFFAMVWKQGNKFIYK